METKILFNPVVFITPEAKQRLDCYIELCSDEVSGLGEVERIGRNFLITSVQIFNQDVTGASTELDKEAVHAFLLALIMEKKDPKKFKLWWHSHVSGEAFWSGTDDETADSFDNEWMISIVGNNRGDYRVRFDLYDPIRVKIDGIPLREYHPISTALRDEVRAELKEKVHRKKTPVITRFVATGGSIKTPVGNRKRKGGIIDLGDS